MSDTDETRIIQPRSVRSSGERLSAQPVPAQPANPRAQWTHDPNDQAIITQYFARLAETEALTRTQLPAEPPAEETRVMPSGEDSAEKTSVLQPPASAADAAETALLRNPAEAESGIYSSDEADTMVAPTRVAPPLPRTAASSSAAHTMPPLRGQADQPYEPYERPESYAQPDTSSADNIDDAEFDDAPAIAPAELPTDWQSEMAPPKATNGFLLPLLLTVPIAAISAAMPAGGAISALVISTCATAYGYARRNQIMREERRGGIRKNSDSFKIALGAPLNLLHALLRAIPDAIAWILTYAAMNGLCSLTAAGNDLEGSWPVTLFGKQVGIPILSGSPMSMSGLLLAFAASIAWLLTAVLRRQRAPLRLGFIQWQLAIRRGANRIASSGLAGARYDTRTHPVSAGFGIALIILLLAFTAAAATVLSAAGSISWLPISALLL